MKTAAALPRAGDRAWHDDDSLRAPGGNTEIGRLLQIGPRPLIYPQARMAVVFSAKSACTSVVVWYLKQIGHLAVARDYHGWPHRYRKQVYYRSYIYRNALRGDLTKLRVVRVVRDPYSRAVSSYRHGLLHGHWKREIARLHWRRDVDEKGYSFAEYLDALERLDLTTCDAHHRIQRHPLENKLPVQHLINVSAENLFARLNEVEDAFGLPRTDMATEPWIEQLRWHNRPEPELADSGDLYTRPFTREQAKVGPWPRYEALLTPDARERIARLYAVDIESYFQGPLTTAKAGAEPPQAHNQVPQPTGISPRPALELEP